jgi:hypothetical protein
MGQGWEIRRYEPSDKSRLKTFSCFTMGQRWTKPPQKVLRAAPDEMEADPTLNILVAVDRDGSMLGAIVFGYDDGEPVIHSMGVVEARRREGIGIALKRAALTDLVLDGTPRVVNSQVHRRNVAMQGLNKRLQVGSVKDPDDGEYLLSSVHVVPKEVSRPVWLSVAHVIARPIKALIPAWRR